MFAIWSLPTSELDTAVEGVEPVSTIENDVQGYGRDEDPVISSACRMSPLSIADGSRGEHEATNVNEFQVSRTTLSEIRDKVE
jgi:hypothetical protein